jgi:hypothetical protein
VYLLFWGRRLIHAIPILDLTIAQKLVVSYLAVVLCVLSCLFALRNLIPNIAELFKFFCKIDCFGKYYETEYLETEESEEVTEQNKNTAIKKETAS